MPLLILVARYDERPAIATSLAAIGLIAARRDGHLWLCTVSFKPGAAAVVGLPAAAGAVLGHLGCSSDWPPRTPRSAFAALLACIGVWLLI